MLRFAPSPIAAATRRPTWPAPPLPVSPWAKKYEPYLPAARRASSPKPTKKAAPPDVQSSSEMWGKVLSFETWIDCPYFHGESADRATKKATVRVYWERGCFSKSIADVKAGREQIALCTMHDTDNVYCSTRDDSLRVWSEESGVYFKVRGTTRSGRSAIRLQRFTGFKEVSVGVKDIVAREKTIDGMLHLMVTEARIVEISLVNIGACPGTWLLVD